MSTLYRDYRPQKFSDILGQNHIKVTIQHEIIASRPAGAYLFCGPRAVGKTTMARVLAKAANCEKRAATDSEPCGECPSCKSIVAGSNLDVIEIDAASNTGVDNVRDNIIAFSRLAPTGSKYKVFIIDEVHMLSISAFNALLKIIEEPPAYVIFVLCTTEIQKVPATIVSRCERFDFRRVSVSDIVKKLTAIAKQEKVAIDASILEAVARRSGGHLRDAESLLGQIFSLGDKKITKEQAELIMPHYSSQEAVSLIECLARKDAAKAVALVNGLADSGTNIKAFVQETISLLRKIMLGKISPELDGSLGLDWGEGLEKTLAPVAASLSLDQVIAMAQRFLDVSGDTRSPLIPQLPLEIAIGELCLEETVSQPKPPIRETQSQAIPAAKAATPPASAAKPSTKPLNSDLNMPAAEVMSRWPELLVKIKKHNHSLSFVLQNCEPRGIESGCLKLAFKYKFHQDRINDPNIKGIMDGVLAEVYGPGLAYATVLDESLSARHQSSDQDEEDNEAPLAPENNIKPSEETGGLMSDLLKTFGGEVIN